MTIGRGIDVEEKTPAESIKDFIADAEDRETRYARGMAHFAFDRLWKERHMTRAKAYTFLAKLFRVEEIHIADMTRAQCDRVIKTCKQLFGEK